MHIEHQQIIDLLSAEIFSSLNSCEHSRNDSSDDRDNIEAHLSSYLKRVKLLRTVREQLENEFTIIHYDPR